MTFEKKLESIKRGESVPLDADNLVEGMKTDSDRIENLLFDAANAVLIRNVGRNCFLRGIIEITNLCERNCLYCKLRRDNDSLPRYSMIFEEILHSLRAGFQAGIRSFHLQTGELLGEKYIGIIEKVLMWTEKTWGKNVILVLALGELPLKELNRLKQAGGSRYMLRIETSKRDLFTQIHPKNGIHRYGIREKCLLDLKNTGWQTGSGTLVGLPWQSTEDMVNDLIYMKNIGVDMCEIEPFLEQKDTPIMKENIVLLTREERFSLSLRMIALTRILLPTISITATAALQKLNSSGLELSLKAGANVFMPNLIPKKYRDRYELRSS